MIRKFKAFDTAVIRREFSSVPNEDARDLKFAMARFQLDAGSGYTVKSYGDGLMMIKGSGQGRCLWFASQEVENGVAILVVFLVYKKESQEVPKRILDTARERMNRYKEPS